MSYPPQYRPAFDFAQAINRGDLPSATELAIELFNAATSINQAIMFVRAFATSNQKIKPAQLRATTNVAEDEQTATAGQTEVLYAGGVTVDASTATVGVFINGDRLAPSDVTVQSDRVVVTPALSGGETILLEIHDNADSVFDKLGSISANLGASLIGIEDVAGYYASANVEEALAEIYEAFSTLVTDLGDLSKYLKADEAVPWEVDQDAGGYKLTNGAPGTESTDFVILQQLDDIVEQFVDLGGRFLPIAGGVMNGTINMAGNPITSLAATPTTAPGDPGYSSVAKHAATKEYVDDEVAGVSGSLGDYLELSGGTMTGPINMDSNEIQNIPTADATGEPVEYDQFNAAIAALNTITPRSASQSLSGTSFDIGALPNKSILRVVVDFEDDDHFYTVEFTLFALDDLWYPTGMVFGENTAKTSGLTEEMRSYVWDDDQDVWRVDGNIGANFSLEFDFSRDLVCALTTGQTGTAFTNVAYEGFSYGS